MKLVSIKVVLSDGSTDTFNMSEVVTYLGDTLAKWLGHEPEDILVLRVWSPVDLLIMDETGKKLGRLHEPTGISNVNEIPNAIYSGDLEPEFIFILGTKGKIYQLNIQGTGEGSFTLVITKATVSRSEVVSFEKVPTSKESSAKLDIFTDSPQSQYDLHLDVEGDGKVDQVISVNPVVESKPGKTLWDVNRDGVVNIFDLVIVGSQFGQTQPQNPAADVNGDGVVNIFDLVIIGAHFGENTVAAAPSIQTSPTPLRRFSQKEIATIQRALAELEAMNHPPPGAAIAIEFLRAWLEDTGFVVTETTLLPNYPNPFNPETWIPYQLSGASEVTITIYDVAGRTVRRIPLGHKAAEVYYSKAKATYWDGKNSAGEPVGSGVYFYHLQTAHLSATRKLVVVK